MISGFSFTSDKYVTGIISCVLNDLLITTRNHQISFTSICVDVAVQRALILKMN